MMLILKKFYGNFMNSVNIVNMTRYINVNNKALFTYVVL